MMWFKGTFGAYLVIFVWISMTNLGCGEPDDITKVPDVPIVIPDSFDINSIKDTYYDLAPVSNIYKWGVYNVHDPSVIKSGDTYYCYNTDVAFGAEVKPGVQIRKSKDLIKWDFVGWVFDGLPAKGSDFIKSKGGTPFNALWAPYIMKFGDEYRLYYSLSSPQPRLSVIGLATSKSPLGPWVEKDIVVVSLNNNDVQTNAIDPSVIIDKSGQHWMYYGSSWDAIYILKLNPQTGLADKPGDIGIRIAHRGFTGNTINGNIEGPEIIYNEKLGMYYLFIAYDWLQTKYNVRVGRSTSPTGPFTDFNGKDMNELSDNKPMIIAPYQFEGHSGWQGVSHPSVFEDGKGQFYMAHQGRPGENSFFMILHVREIAWTEDGWPIVSPERYAAVENKMVVSSDLVGDYEYLVFDYNIVPGFAETQINADFQKSNRITLLADGTISSTNSGTWTYQSPWMILQWARGQKDKLLVKNGRDWENKIPSTILLSGLNDTGIAVWGKKIK